MTSHEFKQLLKQNITPNHVNAGVFKNQDRVKFQITNGNDLDFQSYIKGCGCLGRIILSPKQIDFDIESKYDDTSAQVVYKRGEDYLQKKQVGAVERYFNLKTTALVGDVNPTDLEEVRATRFDKTVQIYFNDGQDYKTVDPDGMLQDNPDKSYVSVQIIFWTLKD